MHKQMRNGMIGGFYRRFSMEYVTIGSGWKQVYTEKKTCMWEKLSCVPLWSCGMEFKLTVRSCGKCISLRGSGAIGQQGGLSCVIILFYRFQTFQCCQKGQIRVSLHVSFSMLIFDWVSNRNLALSSSAHCKVWTVQGIMCYRFCTFNQLKYILPQKISRGATLLGPPKTGPGGPPPLGGWVFRQYAVRCYPP